MSLKVKERIYSLVNKFPKFHLSITSSANRTNFFYVMKEETRIDGPWKDDDPEPPYIPRQCRVKEWRPWQSQLIQILSVWDPRTIHIVYDPRGNIGKSIFITYMGASRCACQIPPINDFKDLMRMVMDMPKLPTYLIDMPRAMNKDKLYQFYSGIETIKSGYAYDDRYSFKYEYFDSPQICVFTNTLPDENLLSKDRWRIWCINYETFELIEGEGKDYLPPSVNSTTSTHDGIF